jgi:hypothetical protein
MREGSASGVYQGRGTRDGRSRKAGRGKLGGGYIKKNSLLPSTLQGKALHDYMAKRYTLHKKLMPLWANFTKCHGACN